MLCRATVPTECVGRRLCTVCVTGSMESGRELRVLHGTQAPSLFTRQGLVWTRRWLYRETTNSNAFRSDSSKRKRSPTFDIRSRSQKVHDDASTTPEAPDLLAPAQPMSSLITTNIFHKRNPWHKAVKLVKRGSLKSAAKVHEKGSESPTSTIRDDGVSDNEAVLSDQGSPKTVCTPHMEEVTPAVLPEPAAAYLAAAELTMRLLAEAIDRAEAEAVEALAGDAVKSAIQAAVTSLEEDAKDANDIRGMQPVGSTLSFTASEASTTPRTRLSVNLSEFKSYEEYQAAKYGLTFWQKDSDATECSHCSRAFTMLRRRHHCRGCGGLTCDACSLSRRRILVAGSPPTKRLERVCDSCVSAQP